MRPYQAFKQRGRSAKGSRASSSQPASTGTGSDTRGGSAGQARTGDAEHAARAVPRAGLLDHTAAEAIDVPRVSIQDALRAMIRAGMHDKAAEAAALAQLQQQERE